MHDQYPPCLARFWQKKGVTVFAVWGTMECMGDRDIDEACEELGGNTGRTSTLTMYGKHIHNPWGLYSPYHPQASFAVLDLVLFHLSFPTVNLFLSLFQYDSQSLTKPFFLIHS